MMTRAPARARDIVRSVPTWLWALLFSVALCLPSLGRFGFWDPWELKIAEQAREVARSGHLFDPTVAGRYPATRPLVTILAALGIKMFGASELGARLLIALAAVGALMAVYWAGAGLLRARAALLATLAMGTMTLFALEARQLTSDAPLVAGLALALGGLGRFGWPGDGRRKQRDLLLGLCGVALAVIGGGVLIGFVLPIAAVVAALLIAPAPASPAAAAAAPVADLAVSPSLSGAEDGTAGLEGEDGTAPLAAAGLGPDIGTGSGLLRPGVRGFFALAALGLLALALIPFSMLHLVAGKFSFWLGGTARAGAPTHTFEVLVRQLGFGLFPWSAVAVFALARPLTRLEGATQPGQQGDRTNRRLAFSELYFFLFAGLGFAVSSYLEVVVGDARYVALPAIALAVGAFLDEALEGIRPEPVTGLLMATGTMIVARDFYMAPEDLASVHLFDKVRWPTSLAVGEIVLVAGFIAAAGVYAGLAARARALGRVPAPDLAGARPLRKYFQRLLFDGGRYGLQAAVACAVLFAFYLTQSVVPRLSTHLSFKPVLESYAKFARPGEKIGKYRIEGHGSGFYSREALVELTSQDRVVQFLRDPDRVFAMVAADELASLDVAFKQAHVPYYVVDASSSRFLLMTNRLDPGQQDENPLIKNVWAPPAGTPDAKPPWTWRVPVAATFGDAIELVGADYPESVHRPGKVALTLIFHVKARPPGGYKIFVHYDGPAQPRVIGDHDPVGHAFGTSFWLPGEYIRDIYETEVPLMTTPAGTYTIYVGFWPGGDGARLKVTRGPNDGADRVSVGTLEIK